MTTCQFSPRLNSTKIFLRKILLIERILHFLWGILYWICLWKGFWTRCIFCANFVVLYCGYMPQKFRIVLDILWPLIIKKSCVFKLDENLSLQQFWRLWIWIFLAISSLKMSKIPTNSKFRVAQVATLAV